MSTAKFIVAFAAALFAASAGCEAADPTTPTPLPEPATETAPNTTTVTVTAPPPQGFHKDPNEVICKRMPMTGSRLIKQRVCFTRREWEEGARDAGAMVNRWQHEQDNTRR